MSAMDTPSTAQGGMTSGSAAGTSQRHPPPAIPDHPSYPQLSEPMPHSSLRFSSTAAGGYSRAPRSFPSVDHLRSRPTASLPANNHDTSHERPLPADTAPRPSISVVRSHFSPPKSSGVSQYGTVPGAEQPASGYHAVPTAPLSSNPPEPGPSIQSTNDSIANYNTSHAMPEQRSLQSVGPSGSQTEPTYVSRPPHGMATIPRISDVSPEPADEEGSERAANRDTASGLWPTMPTDQGLAQKPLQSCLTSQGWHDQSDSHSSMPAGSQTETQAHRSHDARPSHIGIPAVAPAQQLASGSTSSLMSSAADTSLSPSPSAGPVRSLCMLLGLFVTSIVHLSSFIRLLGG